MTRKQTAVEELETQLLFRRCRIGASAAREIAREITSQHGFWDFDERKAAQQTSEATVIALVPAGYAVKNAA